MTTFLNRARRTAMLVLLAGALQSCSGSGTEPQPDAPASLEEVLFRASDREALADGFFPIPMSSSLFDAYSPSGCVYDSVSKSFLCPTVSRAGLTLDQSFALFDAAGNAQSAFSRTTTASVQIKSHLIGPFGVPGTVIIEAADDRTVSGLLGARLVLNGTSTVAMNGVLGAIESAGVQATEVHTADTTVIANLLLPSRNSRWPGPGTITARGTDKFDDLEWHSLTRATFNGTKCVSIEVFFGALATTRVIDLTNALAASCSP